MKFSGMTRSVYEIGFLEVPLSLLKCHLPVENINMILEVAILNIKAGMTEKFEEDFKTASAIISSMSGYISHELKRCLEKSDQYILLVRWNTLEAHTIGFRQSPEYQEWKRLLHHYYDPFPAVDHYKSVYSNDKCHA